MTKRASSNFFLWISIFFLLPFFAFTEGTKELMPDSAASQRAYILIANGNAGGALRDPFALYNGDTSYRLYIRIADYTKERIYFGLGAPTSGGAVNWRIHRPDGAVIWSGTTPSLGQQGFIRFYSQAYAGPTKLNPTQGYPANVVVPISNGDYFMTFQVSNNSSRVYEKVDISVVDTITNTYKRGRVHSKAWQLSTNEPSRHNFYGKLYVYSNDGVVSLFDPNGFDGMWFTVSCNESGCYPIAPPYNAQQARQSTYGWHNYPQYKIFLNNPDTILYPSGIIGQLVPGSLYTATHCDSGTIDFIFQTTALGTAEITLELSTLGPPYVNRILVETVTGGIDTITWDGKDGNGVSVPSGSTFPFTLRYYNGLTHLPLWDVEGNVNGFKVNLFRPQTVPPIPDPEFFWDDSQVGGSINITPPGCTSTPTTGCHAWNPDWGDLKTINTWWYVVSTSTAPATVMYKKGPNNLGTIAGPDQVCQGGIAQFSVNPDPSSQKYIWSWPGGVDTTTIPMAILTFPLTTPPGPVQVTVHGYNTECGNGPLSSKTVTVNQIPSVTNSPLIKTICNNTSTNINLTSNVPGATFAWRVWSTNPNLGGYLNGSGSVISQTLTNVGTTTDTVRYRIAATANGCLGDSVTYKVAVHPVPDLSNTPKSKQQCNNLNTNITLTSNVTGTQFTWTCTPSSPNITGWSNNPTPTTLLDQTLVNTGFQIETVTYHITPQANGCNGVLTDYIVTVYPTPNLSNSPPLKEICQSQSTNITLTSNVLGTTFTWTCTQASGNVSGWSPNPGPGTTVINQTLTLTGVVKDSVLYHLTPRANNCNGPVTDFKVIVHPVPQLNVSPMTDSICSGVTTNIILTSTVAGSSFSWTAAKGPGNVTGFSNGSGPVIAQQLFNPDPTAGSVLYTITPVAGMCTGNSSIYTIWVKPLPHLTNQPKGDSICSGASPNLTLTSDVTNTWFTWTAAGSSPFVSGYSDEPNPVTLLNQTLTNTGYDLEWVTYLITPVAAGCQGPDSSYIVTVFPVPDLSNNPSSTAICSGESPGVTLTSNVAGTLFTWTATGSSPNVTGYANNPVPADFLNQTLINTGDDIETVTYHLTPIANGCNGVITDFTVTVYPVPDLSTTPLFKEICNNNSTGIILTSNVSGTLFTWTATGSSPFVTGYADNTTNPMTLIDQNLINSGSVNETVTYHIVPQANGCPGDTTDYVVTVIPSPYLTNDPLNQSQCNNVSTNLTLLSNVAGTQFTWTADGSSGFISGYANSTAPGTQINQTLVNSGFNNETVTYHITPENSGCPGSVTDYTVTVYPVPDVYFVPNGQTLCEGQVSNLSLLSHVTGTTFTWTASASSPNLSGYSDGSGDLIAQTISNAGSTIEWVTYQATPEANNCPPGTTMPVVLTVNPCPVVTNAVTLFTQCNNITTSISLQADVTGSIFAWRAFTGSPTITGYSNGSGAVITQTLINPGFTIDTVTYRVAATANGCSGDSTDFNVVVFPVADVIFTPASQVLCSGKTTGIAITSNVAGTSFTWTATGSAPEVTGFSAGSGNLIQQILYNSGYMMPTVTYLVTPTANGCTGTQHSAVVTVNPKPTVSFAVCFDTLTTTQAQPFPLKGALPPGGTFTGSGVAGTQFFPAIAGAGIHQIRYTYANNFGCVDSAFRTIQVASPVPLTCGDSLTDIRDGRNYPTVQIGTQCWLAFNLNFGTTVASSQMQRDNCVNEKYCYNDNPANCTAYGGLYQWDEAMRYASDNGAQGLCPPGWHVPAENDWNNLFNFYISNGFAGSALKASGFSGFNAFMTGIRFHNNVWKFPLTDPVLRSKLYWSSTLHGLQKAWAHGMNEVAVDIEYTPSVSFYPALRSNAFAVRCIRD